MPAKLLCEGFLLHAQGVVPMGTAPLAHSLRERSGFGGRQLGPARSERQLMIAPQ
jgi:hypothetical protein